MIVQGFRKPTFAASGCCILLILCASLCLSESHHHDHFHHAHDLGHLIRQSPLGYTVYKPYPISSPGYGGENINFQGPAEYYPYVRNDALQYTARPQSPVAKGSSSLSDTQKQSPYANDQAAESRPNGDSSRQRQQERLTVQGTQRQKPTTTFQQGQPGQNGPGPSAAFNVQNFPRQSQGDAISFPGNSYYSQRETAPSQASPGALQFAFNMLKAHVLPQRENSAICPILPQMLLASLYDVADKEAKSQLQTALQASSKELQLALNQQLQATNQSAANQLDFASTFFIGKDTKINPHFSNQAAQQGVTFQKVDFRNPTTAATTANSWVTEKTRGIIREIITPANLDPATRLMMASVIYFKGKWKFQFTKTEPAIFESSPNTPKQVQMMYQFNKFRYGEIDFKSGNGLHWVDLPYEGSSELSMVLILPKVRHQLQRSLEEFSAHDMKQMMDELTERQRGSNKVNLFVPRFGVLSSSSLVPALKSLGLTSIFDRSTALISLANEELVVRDVSQQTYIAVDEKGTTATSVASLNFVALSAAPPPPTINFTVNEPFLAMIVDKKHAYPMFVAKVVTPEEI